MPWKDSTVELLTSATGHVLTVKPSMAHFMKLSPLEKMFIEEFVERMGVRDFVKDAAREMLAENKFSGNSRQRRKTRRIFKRMAELTAPTPR